MYIVNVITSFAICEIAIMGYVVKETEGANRADGTDETDMAEMALCMNALSYSILF